MSGLDRLRASGRFEEIPNEWQLRLGILRMAHRIVFRSGTIGTSRGLLRGTLRARVLSLRLVRLPFLLWERAIAPLDLSGLGLSKERLLRHLLGAHHDQNQFIYDLELLEVWPGALEELRDRTSAVVSGEDPRARWLRDLVVFEGYHESLLAAVEAAIDGTVRLDERERCDPDITLRAYLAWCCRQPPTLNRSISALFSREGVT